MLYDELMTLIKTRRSVRRFLPRAVSREDVEKLIEAARWAPSNHNRQGWYFVVISDRDAIRKLAADTRSAVQRRVAGPDSAGGSTVAREHVDELLHYAALFSDAPCVIIAMHKKPTAISRHLLAGASQPEVLSGEPLSTAMAAENILLAAHALGLGACVMTAPLAAEEEFAQAAALPPGYVPTCVIAVGHPAETPPEPPRKAFEKIVEIR